MIKFYIPCYMPLELFLYFFKKFLKSLEKDYFMYYNNSRNKRSDNMKRVMFYDCNDFMVFETDAQLEDLIEWAGRYNEIGFLSINLKKPNNCSMFDLIFDTVADCIYDVVDCIQDFDEEMKIDYKIDLNNLKGELYD